ncbi:DUF418 domain-containing protein [Streptomyces violaceus]|uniref:DUF418 domain-containing protein n=1 Tax=Streptomyces violaceus TaxID=1936 RepID=UPI0019BB1694|nr:hypothetical protein GCM10010270_14170 [Streptomyces janthinus]
MGPWWCDEGEGGRDDRERPGAQAWLLNTEEATVPPLYVLLGFIASVAVLATIWSRFFQRGPLEWLMGRATGIARRIQ